VIVEIAEVMLAIVGGGAAEMPPRARLESREGVPDGPVGDRDIRDLVVRRHRGAQAAGRNEGLLAGDRVDLRLV